MPGGLTQEIDNVVAISATTTKTLLETSDAAYSNASFWVEVEAVTGGSTWTVQTLRTFGTQDVVLAQIGSLSSAQAAKLDILAALSGALDPKGAIPHPTKVKYVLTSGTGTLTATVYMTYGD